VQSDEFHQPGDQGCLSNAGQTPQVDNHGPVLEFRKEVPVSERLDEVVDGLVDSDELLAELQLCLLEGCLLFFESYSGVGGDAFHIIVLLVPALKRLFLRIIFLQG